MIRRWGTFQRAWPRAFMGLWIGETVSSVGSQVSLVAIPLLAAVTLHSGPAEMAILGALETVPFVILSLPAGVLADRSDRRSLLITCDVLRAVAMASLPLVFLTGDGSFLWLCVTASVVGGLSAVFVVAQQAYVPELVGPDLLVKANQRLEISDSAARIAGPGIAALLFDVGGSLVAVGLDAASYVISAVSIALGSRVVPTSAVPAVPVSGPDAPLRAIAAGIRFVWRDGTLRCLVLSTAVFNLASGMVLAQLVLFATGNLAISAAGFGLFMAVGNAGFIVGAGLVGRLEERLGPGMVLIASSVCGAAALWLIAGAAVGGFGLLLLGRFVGAMSAPVFNVMLVSVRQARSPEALRARVVATFRTVDWGTAPLGALMSGLVGAVAGVPVVMTCAAVIGTTSVLWLLAPSVRETRIELAGGVPSRPGLELGIGAP